ncbi:flagellar motor protein [Rheinheimera riviphila]|uniref:Flagellar motor protein n=1 Tax=Rheinheimera riviphila TaxID=1834037 RepID=A0A437QZP9_9GAMM|nr:flagellar motor protein [Rheinheimera riviphila]RVU39933.1 flagellar motor protein [Rheinheimera riviphila]
MSLIGLIIALCCIIGGNILEGGHPGALLNGPAFLIVVGSTFGAALTQFPFSAPMGAIKRFKWLIIPLKLDLYERSMYMQELSNMARKGGFLALEEKIDDIADPFLKKGLGMLIDGFDKDRISETLEDEIEFEQEDLEFTAKFYEAMGGYCPTMGIIGAVLGLIHAMGLLDRPDELGGGIAVAFVATIYGVAFANLIFLPFGNRYKFFAHEIKHYKMMTLVAIMGIADGISPQQLATRLEGYVGGHGGKTEEA